MSKNNRSISSARWLLIDFDWIMTFPAMNDTTINLFLWSSFSRDLFAIKMWLLSAMASVIWERGLLPRSVRGSMNGCVRFFSLNRIIFSSIFSFYRAYNYQLSIVSIHMSVLIRRNREYSPEISFLYFCPSAIQLSTWSTEEQNETERLDRRRRRQQQRQANWMLKRIQRRDRLLCELSKQHWEWGFSCWDERNDTNESIASTNSNTSNRDHIFSLHMPLHTKCTMQL